MIQCAAVISTHRHIQEVQRIHTYIEQRATGAGRIDHAGLAGHWITQVGACGFHLADFSGGNDLIDELTTWHVTRPNRFRAQQSCFLGYGQSLARLCGIRGERLLHEHVLAGLHAQNRLLGMQIMRSGDIDQINIRVSHQILIRTIRFVEMPLIGECLCAIQITGSHGIRVNP